jgi:hypothetical protein
LATPVRQRSAQVVVLGLQAIQPCDLLGALQIRLGLIGQAQEIFGMPPHASPQIALGDKMTR